MILSKEQILAQRLPTEKVSIPWMKDAEIIVRALPHHVTERDEGSDKMRHARLFVNALIDESGARIYEDSEAETIANTVDRALMEFVVSTAMRLSSPSKQQREAIKKNWKTLIGAKSGE